MKSFGVIAKMDKKGGIELTGMLMGLCKVEAGDELEMYLDEDKVVMKKFPQTCIFCGSAKGLKEYMNKNICFNCAEDLKNY